MTPRDAKDVMEVPIESENLKYRVEGSALVDGSGHIAVDRSDWSSVVGVEVECKAAGPDVDEVFQIEWAAVEPGEEDADRLWAVLKPYKTKGPRFVKAQKLMCLAAEEAVREQFEGVAVEKLFR